MKSKATHAVVLLSGGLDSATALAWARAQGFTCHALSVHYGQRHDAELAAAARVAATLGAREHRVVRVDLAGIGGSALGPQLVSYALGRLKAGRDKMRVHFFDNTDPDGIDPPIPPSGRRRCSATPGWTLR